jgi:hypothetical protein
MLCPRYGLPISNIHANGAASGPGETIAQVEFYDQMNGHPVHHVAPHRGGPAWRVNWRYIKTPVGWRYRVGVEGQQGRATTTFTMTQDPYQF